MIPIHTFISAKVRLRQSGGNWTVAKSKAVGAAIAHVKYIGNRPGQDLEPGGRKFFDDEKDSIDGKDIREWVKDQYPGGNVVVHKLTIAPEINLEPEDEKIYARTIMQELSNKLGQDIDWKGVQHNNTDNHHVHCLIAAKDKSGRDVRISLDDCEALKRASDEFLSKEYPRVWELVVEPKRNERDLPVVELIKEEKAHPNPPAPKEREQLPFLGAKKKAIVKELLMPYGKWKELNKGPEEVDSFKTDAIVYEGREYTYATDLDKLKNLDNSLWERPPDEWLPKNEYIKLRAWIHSREDNPGGKPKYNYLKPSLDPEKFTFDGQEYSKDSDRLEFRDLAKKLYQLNKSEREAGESITRLAPEDNAKFQYWKEDKDRLWGQEIVRDMLSVKDEDRPYISSKKKLILKELQCPFKKWIEEHPGPEPVNEEEVEANAHRYNYLERSSPDSDGFIFKYGNYTKEFTDESYLWEFKDLAKTLYEINKQERENNYPLTRLHPEDDAKFKYWKELKERQWGERFLQELKEKRFDLPTAEEQQLELQERTMGDAGHGPTASIILQDSKPGNEQATAKLIELPHDELEQIDKYLEELSHSKYQDWLMRNGANMQKHRLDDDRAIDEIEETRNQVKNVQSTRDRELEKQRRMKEALILGLEAYELGQQRLEDELER